MGRLLLVLWVSCCGLACASLPRDSLSRLDYTALVNRWGLVLDGYSYTQATPNFSYDDANRLIEVYATNNWRSTYTYDGLSRRRIRKDYAWQAGWSLSDETHYIYLGNSVIQERNSLNQTKVSYTRGFGLLARTDSTNGSLYYHIDGNNNVTALINGQGTLVARYTYDPFGNLIGKHGSLADVNLYRFASQEVHPPSGLYAYTYRFYDPNLQRWINKDPIGYLGGRNPFAFVGNNPINAVDPDGLDSLVPGVNGSYNNSVPALTLTGTVGGPVTTSYPGLDSLFIIGGITMGGMAAGGSIESVGVDLGLENALLFAGWLASILTDQSRDCPPKPLLAGVRQPVYLQGEGAPEAVYSHLNKFHGISPGLASERLHAIKQAEGIPANGNVIFDLTGNLYFPTTMDLIGSLTAGGAKGK